MQLTPFSHAAFQAEAAYMELSGRIKPELERLAGTLARPPSEEDIAQTKVLRRTVCISFRNSSGEQCPMCGPSFYFFITPFFFVVWEKAWRVYAVTRRSTIVGSYGIFVVPNDTSNRCSTCLCYMQAEKYGVASRSLEEAYEDVC